MKQWKCSICGYVHKGEEPPDICPVCGADKSDFILLDEIIEEMENSAEDKYDEETIPFKLIKILDNMIIKHHLHPISVHIPNGIIPVAVLFLILGSFLDNQSLKDAAYYNLTIVFLSLPFVLYSGFVEWRDRFSRAGTSVFKIKISAAVSVALLCSVITLWKSFFPEADGAFFNIIHFLLLVATVIAGHLGGKFVFKD